jgi:hypothetical protein
VSEYVQREEGITNNQPPISFINPAAAFLNNKNPNAAENAGDNNFADPAAFQFSPKAQAPVTAASTEAAAAPLAAGNNIRESAEKPAVAQNAVQSESRSSTTTVASALSAGAVPAVPERRSAGSHS